jgi:hypothetical protein
MLVAEELVVLRLLVRHSAKADLLRIAGKVPAEAEDISADVMVVTIMAAIPAVAVLVISEAFLVVELKTVNNQETVEQ